MKIKNSLVFIVLFSVVSLVVIFKWSFHHLSTPTTKIGFSASEELIAPAILDAQNDITHISSLHHGLINSIFVHVGQKVKKGQVLFSLDNTITNYRLEKAELVFQEAQNAQSIQIERVAHLQTELKRLKSIDPRAISRQELQEKQHQLTVAKIKQTQIQNHLDAASSNVAQMQAMITQLTQRAPMDGIVLRVNAHPHEYINNAQTIIVLGDAHQVIVRVSIDERDVTQFNSKAQAYLISSDDETVKIPLHFIQKDRYIIHQKRLNTRVQEVLYSFNRNDYPQLIPGQQLDAHIILTPIKTL